MKLTTLALKGIRHNFRNYAMYFFAMCFCVFTTYTFAALALSESVSEMLGINRNYQNMFIGFGIVILVFVFFFLLSSNKSFIKYRKREISTYALFGMPNGRIARLLFIETLMIGVTALVAGILLGVFFSKLMVMLLLKMVMLAFSGDIAFSINPVAIVVTAAVFLVTFIIMGLSGRRVINRFSLVDLFKGEKVAEKKTKGSAVMLVLSVVLIASGYFFALQTDSATVLESMIFVIAVVVLGSYLFFAGGLQKVLSLIKKNKRRLYKQTRLVSISLLAHKSGTMASVMGTIAVLVAVATTAIAFGHTIYQSAEDNARETSSFDVWYCSADETTRQDVQAVLDRHGLAVTGEVNVQRYVSVPKPVGLPSEYSDFFDTANYSVTYSESDYQKITGVSEDSNGAIAVQPGEAAVLYPFFVDIEAMEAEDIKLAFGDTKLNVTLKEVVNPYSFGGMLMTFVLDDSDFDALLAKGEIITNNGEALGSFTGINYQKAFASGAAAQELTQVVAAKSDTYRVAYNFYIDQMRVFGLVCFIGYFICAVFILMSASMLYFKQVVIGIEEKSQYVMLRKIGMSADEEKRVMRGRLMPVFFMPLVMGIVHSLFAMKAADTLIFSNIIIVQGSSYTSVLKASFAMYAIYVAVYTVFYFVTKSQYRKAIR